MVLYKNFEKRAFSVILTKVGIHNKLKIPVCVRTRTGRLDSRLHGNDHLDYLWQNSKVSIFEFGLAMTKTPVM